MSKIALFRTKLFQVMFSLALVIGVGVAFAIDSDNDGMSDLYETFFQLNPTDGTDAAENYDTDLLNNLQESAIWTDPGRADTDVDGFPDDADSNALSRAVIWWGNPEHTDGDTYTYTGPDWWLGAGRDGGAWNDDGGWQLETNAQGMLYIDINRSMVTNNLMLNLLHVNAADSVVYLALADTNEARVAVDLFGDLTSNDSEQVLSRYILPLAAYPTASRIIIDATATTEPYTVWVTTLYVDMDADGLDADQEKQMGTSDKNSDSDGDGLSDYREVIEFETDPMNADSDGDGLPDALEAELGTNPTSEDSDDDGLTDAEELAKHYFLSDNPLTWLEAKAFAEASGGHLAVLTSEDELNAAKSAFPDIKRARPWLGATDAEEDGVWKWITGESFEYARWGEGEPNNYGGPQMYLRFTKKYYWDDAGASDLAPVLVEFPNGLDPNNTDTDGDGISDGTEIKVHKTNARAMDSDGDGISDPNEIARGLNPLKVDTDADGLTDAEELSLGLDPTNPDTDGDGLGDKEELNHQYQIIQTQMTWPEAKTFAEQSGGHLATFSSQEEFYASLAACTNARAVKPWLGATDEAQEGVWQWVTGEAFDYTRWATNEPNNYQGLDMYLRVGNKTEWYDENPSRVTGLMIEYAEGLDPRNPDCDGDGLTDGDEINLYGSSARSGDTDGDGISDFEEVALGTDPASRDTDSDGIEDPVEISMGLDPTNSDTDGDGLEDGAELTHRYRLFTEKMTWPEAVLFAEAKGGYLATMTSKEEIDLAFNVAAGIRYFHPWLGAEERSEGVWEWVTGEAFEYTNWSEGEPNNYKGPQMYLHFFRGQGWDDASADAVTGLLVEYAQGLDPLSPDSDNDGVIDGDEIVVYHSDPRSTDTDGDGISDGDEVAAGMDPTLVDSDGDGIDDPVELEEGLNPASADTDGDGLDDWVERMITGTNPLNTDSNTNGVTDLTVVQSIQGADFYSCYDSHISATWSTTGTTAVVTAVYGAPTATYQVTVATPGIHQLAVYADAAEYAGVTFGEVEMNIEIDGLAIGRAKRCVVDGAIRHVLFTPWLSEGTHTITMELMDYRGRRAIGAFFIRSLELGAVDGVDSDGDGVPDWTATLLLADTDTDGDGISDLDEISIHGTSPTDADTDGDGLNDGAELAARTDPLDADSDDDGVVDGVEVNESLTNPLIAEFDGTITLVETISGAATNTVAGNWEIQGSELLSKGVRGSVEYVMNFPTNDLLRLNINAVHSWSKSSCSPVIPKDTSAFLVYVDDVYVGKFPLVSADGVYVDVNAFLPFMPAGEHTVRLYWENVYSRLAVKIQSLELQSLGGPDNNGNGTKDWVEASISSMAGVDNVGQAFQPVQSFVSPACIEGAARYVEFMELVGQAFQPAQGQTGMSAPQRGAGPRWYANLPLEQHGTTTATATFQNGALEVPIHIEWTALNLMEHDGETILVRKGDSVKFVALPEGANGGQFELEYLLDVEGETERSPNTRPLVRTFSDAGTYTVSGQYTHGNTTLTASIQVVVLDGSFPEESPACLVGRERQWIFEGMPSNVVFQVDDTVEMEVLSCAANVTNQSSIVTKVALRANDTNGDHMLVARLYDGGPVLDAASLDTFWIQNAVDGYFWTVESYEDSELWEVQSVAKNVPNSVGIQIKVIVGGVTLDDYTLERWLANTAYNEIGEYNFRLFHPNDAPGSTCHTFKLYQDGELIGEAYGAGQNDIEEE